MGLGGFAGLLSLLIGGPVAAQPKPKPSPAKTAPKAPVKTAPKAPIKTAPKAPIKTAPKAPVKTAPKAPTLSPRSKIERALVAGKPGAAAFICELEAKKGRAKKAGLPRGLRLLCARAYVLFGQRLAAIGAADAARKRWRKAAQWDGRLLADQKFVMRLFARKGALRRAFKRKRSLGRKPRPRIRAKSKPVAPPGPRANRTFSLGLGFGFDGLLSVVAGWMHNELVAVEVAVGILFRTVDTRIRFYGHRDVVTPVVGFGMTTAFGPDARFELEIPGYQDLYRLGQTFHVDIGVSWAVWKMDLFAGMAFLTTIDQEHPDRLLFFPQFAVQALMTF